jgi:hypothetical protein
MKKSPADPVLAASYPYGGIHGLAALSKALGIHQNVLVQCASTAHKMYRLAKQEVKPDNSIRQTFDAYPRLKSVQIRIKERILQRVLFPSYLHGSIRGCSPRTNAAMHVRAKITFAEDITNFFPSASRILVKRTWVNLFGFSEDVANLLTDLTTLDGGLPQGAVTSSFLANLVFWDYEPFLVKTLASRGLTYSRYVDDVTVSAKRRIEPEDKTYVVAQIYGMLLHHGFFPNRRKHEINTSKKSMRTTKLVHNTRVALPGAERKRIRAAVFELERRVSLGVRGDEVTKDLASVSTRVGRLGSYHKVPAAALKKRLSILRAILTPLQFNSSFTMTSKAGPSSNSISPPWEIS